MLQILQRLKRKRNHVGVIERIGLVLVVVLDKFHKPSFVHFFSDQTGIPQSEIAPEFIELKREQILLRRTAVAMETAAQHERKANEDISNND